MRDLTATDLEIQVHSERSIKIIKEGFEGDISNIHVERNGNKIEVFGSSNQRSSNVHIGNISISGIRQSMSSIFSRSGSVVIGNGVISVGCGNENNDTKVTVVVPKGCPVAISGIDGRTRVGDTEGSLRVHATLAGAVQIGHVINAALNIQGSSDIVASRIDGEVSASIQGSGDIKIRQGAVTTLNATVQGSGDIRFEGSAQNASLSVMGSGDIDVAFVKNRPSKNVMGSGKIKVGNW